MKRPNILGALFGRADQAGMTVAIAFAPATFQRTLIPRNAQDQGIATGMSLAISYLLASMVQDSIEAAGSRVLGPSFKDEADDSALRRITLAFDVAAIATGVTTQLAFKQEQYEPLHRAALRTGGYWMSIGALGGLSAAVAQEWLQSVDRGSKRDIGLRRLPAPLVAGAFYAGLAEIARRRREARWGEGRHHLYETDVRGSSAILIGAGLAVGLATFSALNRAAARRLGVAMDFLFPGGELLWRPVGRLTALGALGAVGIAALNRVNAKIEDGAGKIEPAFGVAPTTTNASGGTGSLVSWETLSREGRRHVVTQLRREWIEDVMGEPAIEPIRAYVGLDSAATEEERVDLAIAELQRTGAFDRKLLIAVSPTGTGYVNYTAIEAAEYMTRGSCATVTMQYSKRPSPLSLDRVWEGRKHFRMMISAIRRKLYERAPEDRPRLVVFGESLGAHTSQDAFLHTGTVGLQDAGVERALWIGTPHLSGWKKQVLGKPRPDTERSLVGEFNDFEQVEALDPDARSRLRYFLVTHGNDGVGRFGPDLFIQQPPWLGDAETRPTGVPKSQVWRTPITGIQTLIDMKNAMDAGPGGFVANGHDYRADLARFVREAYGLSCSDVQLERIEVALRRYDSERSELFKKQAATQQEADAKVQGRANGAEPASDPETAAPST